MPHLRGGGQSARGMLAAMNTMHLVIGTALGAALGVILNNIVVGIVAGIILALLLSVTKRGPRE